MVLVDCQAYIRAEHTPETCIRPLSILDATVVPYPPSSATWFFQNSLSRDRLITSLQELVNDEPQYAGSVSYRAYTPQATSHCGRHGRVQVTYGGPDQPGVALSFAQSVHTISGFLPSSTVQDVDELNLEDLPSTIVPILDGSCVSIQVTFFACGGTAITTSIIHVMADATTLSIFMTHWSNLYSSRTHLAIAYEPSRLDSFVSGDVDCHRPDLNMLAKAKELQILHYDRYNSSKDCPTWAIEECSIPEALSTISLEPLGVPIPWSDWSMDAPVKCIILTLTKDQISSLYGQVSGASHLDAILAYIWTTITLSRSTRSCEVNLYHSIGLRNRLGMALAGSPIMICTVTTSHTNLTYPALEETAQLIRSRLNAFTPERIGAELHRIAHQSSAQRYWDACLGDKHVLTTSWIGCGTYDVRFDESVPVWCRCEIPALDGMVSFADLPSSHETHEPWWQHGVQVTVGLKSSEMPIFRQKIMALVSTIGTA